MQYAFIVLNALLSVYTTVPSGQPPMLCFPTVVAVQLSHSKYSAVQCCMFTSIAIQLKADDDVLKYSVHLVCITISFLQ
jgi:hypothetical protein